MSDTASALRATSDALLADLEALEALENEKRELAPGDDRLVALAGEVEEIARRVLGRSVQQRELSAVAHAKVEANAPGAPTMPIAETPREIHLILADWRAAERRAQEAAPGSAEAVAAQAEAERLREEYRTAQQRAATKR